MPSAAHISPTATTSSGTRGAKHEVVVRTAAMRSAPTRSTAACMPAMSVANASPCSAVSTTTHVRPAAVIDFQHAF